ncbi:hypothetical protein PPSIR1_09400 [Plesiocystis pacifica SIR-1]|uniref:Rieske domain-containing protein n=1 Tax=Plesiocystis pacifica SIR-1 TaxID=391625 RepID=A6GJV5_9BACT|nr:aromatic ring-hydroxylating dioxygenase subunit alpha [Plesiocystis pacifica]EDM73853.1 hypothetical protein PPSIR1_09400 [Plesiocystis pacifica SIR-1]
MPALDARRLLAELAQTRAPLDEARTLPASAYRSPELFALEMRELFAKMWLCVGREEQVEAPRAFITHALGPEDRERALIVRDDAGTLRAFYNVCRHRAARLIDAPRGSLRAINCPYHKWSYGLDGRLRHAPRTDASFDCAAHSLIEMPLAVFEGHIYVNLDAHAPPREQAHADLPSAASHRLGELRVARRHDYTVAANWKVVIENYGECYHCAVIHPQLHRLSDFQGGAFVEGACFNGGPMRLREGVQTLSMSGASPLGPIPGLAEADRDQVHYNHVYPNFTLALHPDYVLTHTVWPLSPEQTRVHCEWLVWPAALEGEAPADLSDILEFWDRTNRQDWDMCARVQQGLRSAGYRRGPYTAMERCIHAFDRWYVEAIGPALEALR